MQYLLAALAAFFIVSASAREQYAGQYDNIVPAIRQWFQSQRVPGTTYLCCSMADGVYAEEDIRGEHYWVRFQTQEGVEVDWLEVPDEKVIKDANPNGAPVVWYSYANGKPVVRCFCPGAGI